MIISHDQLTLGHHKLLDRALVAGGEVPSPHLHLHLERKITQVFFYGERSPTLPFSHSKRLPHSHPVTTLPSPSCTKDSMSVTGLLLNIPLVTSILIPLDVVTILQKLMCRSPLFMIKVREIFLLMLSIPGGDKGWV